MRSTALELRWLVRFAAVAIVGMVACSGGTPDTDLSQHLVAHSAPGPQLVPSRTEVGSARWNNQLVVAGGFLPDDSVTSRVDAYSPALEVWRQLPDLPTPRHHVALAQLSERLFAIGGFGVDGAPIDEVWSLGPKAQVWRSEPALVEPRGAAAAATRDGRLWVVGGVGADSSVLDRTEYFEDKAGKWSRGPMLIEAREHLALAVLGDHLYAVAGRERNAQGTASVNKRTVEVLEGQGWSRGPPLNDARSGIGAAVVNDFLCVAGGEGKTIIGTIECLVDDRWTRVGSLGTPRHGFAIGAFEDRIHVIAGGPEPELTYSGAHEVVTIVQSTTDTDARSSASGLRATRK